MEVFVECQWDNSYLIGDDGTVKSLSKQRLSRYGTDILTGLVKANGYKQYWIRDKWYYAHRLVAIHFVDNPNQWVEINHIDGVKLNNNKANIEWSTRKLNYKHRIQVLGQVNAGPPKGLKRTQATKNAMSKAKLGKHRDKDGKWY